SFALMPNHFHLLLRQTKTKGVEKFLTDLQNSFAKYFNIRYKRGGSLFQKPFKAKRLSSDEEFLHVSRYIHLNPVTSFLIKCEELKKYPWTSYPSYVRESEEGFIDTNFILNLTGSKKRYEKFISNQVDYQKKLHLIKNLVF
ncbi:transposase, partial [Patescibacteria group bacterium]|nr:transposase [Patescibacteria group bacterium]